MKLNLIQNELKAPKGQYNNFGKYKYRNCEDILEALKPLLLKHECALIVSDELVMIGERYYVKATATLTVCENGALYTVTAYAREEENKKGMDGAQVTGAASSYARKYALNGLFAIDDTKDADTQDNTSAEKAAPAPVPPQQKLVQLLAAKKEAKWFEVKPFTRGAFKGKELAEVVVLAGAEVALIAMGKYVESYYPQYPLAKERLKSAIAEARSNSEKAELEGLEQGIQHESAGDRD
jgi:hypothetical protein